MKNLQPYIALVFALLLIAGPWLQTATIKAAPTVPDSSNCHCCNGPCQGCCCSPADANDKAKHPEDNCGCKLSDLPVIPEAPLVAPDRRTDEHVSKILPVVYIYYNFIPDYEKTATSDKLPPLGLSPPAYVLFGAFLI